MKMLVFGEKRLKLYSFMAMRISPSFAVPFLITSRCMLTPYREDGNAVVKRSPLLAHLVFPCPLDQWSQACLHSGINGGSSGTTGAWGPPLEIVI